MNIIELVKKYTDKFGLVQPTPNSTSGNGLLFTSEMYIILNRLDVLTDIDRQVLKDVIQSCQVGPGLYNRSPNDTSLNAQDDLIGVAALAHEMGWKDINEEIIARAQTKTKTPYGISVSNVFDNTGSGKFIPAAWLGRFPVVIAHLYFSANKTPSLFYRLAFCLDMLASLFKKPKANKHDYWLLGWLMAYTARGKSFMCDLAIMVFFSQVERHGGMGKIVSDYFTNNEHPISLTWGKISV